MIQVRDVRSVNKPVSARAVPLRMAGMVVLPVLLFFALACRENTRDSSRPLSPREERAGMRYVGRQVCAECHETETALWTGSDHDLAMDPATPESVLGDFDDATFTQYGVTTRFFRDQNRYFVHTQGKDGTSETFPVAYTFGARPLQQYLVEFPDGRLQALTVAWDTEKQRWFSLYPDEKIEPGDWLHWTGGGMNWNYMCADCHSTDLQKNFDVATNTYRTTWFEIDVSCEACHGPGERHVALAREAEQGGAPYDSTNSGFTVRLSGPENARTQIETCAPCHSRRRVIDPNFLPGDSYYDHYEVELLEDVLYYPDGQIKDEVYEYASFLQSKMYRNGVRCSDCHDPHSTRTFLEGNDLCSQCHDPAVYDSPLHHHHPDESQPGAQCVDCHMPERPYMVVDPRRDHSFQLPRPDLSVKLGIPNVCNRCHEDQSAEWAARQVVSWYGPNRLHEPHFAPTFVAGRQGDPGAEAGLISLASDTARAGIVRATALSILTGYQSDDAYRAARQSLTDPDPLVRFTAIRNLGNLPVDEIFDQVAPLLTDSLRLVRVEAARTLSRSATERFAADPRSDYARAFRQALDEYRKSQEAVSDQAAAHLNLAVLEENLGNPERAEERYLTALRLDSTFTPARINLAMLLDYRRQQAEQAGRASDARLLRARAEEQLRAAVRQDPDQPDVRYMLGLLLAEDPGRLAEAAEHLLAAARLNPEHARVSYNAGLAFQQLGDDDKAEELLLNAYRLEPEQPDFLNALSIFYLQRQRWPEALPYTEALLKQFPGEAELARRMDLIRRNAAP